MHPPKIEKSLALSILARRLLKDGVGEGDLGRSACTGLASSISTTGGSGSTSTGGGGGVLQQRKSSPLIKMGQLSMPVLNGERMGGGGAG